MGSVTPIAKEELPFWQVNVPEAEREETCPEFLAILSAKDKGIIGTPDSSYTEHDWPCVREIIRTNRLNDFRRRPSQLRRYLAYNFGLKQKYGSVMAFIIQERLHWDGPVGTDETTLRQGFGNPENWKILWNDWPYGIDERIVHLVVWTKFELEEVPGTDDLKPEVKQSIDNFVQEKFVKKLGEENVIWFKNWKSLKSVHAVEHFHVMLFEPPTSFVDEVTNGDIPLCRLVK